MTIAAGPSEPASNEKSWLRQAVSRGPQWYGRRYVSVLGRPQTWLNLLYLLLSFPIGLASFITVTFALALGSGLAITVVGLPFLVLAMYGWRHAARFEAWLSNTLLGTRISARLFGVEHGVPWQYEGILARVKNARSWRALAFHYFRFVQGIVAIVACVTLLGFAPGGIMAIPLASHNGLVFDSWTIDTPVEAVVVAVLAVLLTPATFYLLNGLAWISGRANQLILGVEPASEGEPNTMERAKAAYLAFRQPAVAQITEASVAPSGEDSDVGRASESPADDSPHPVPPTSELPATGVLSVDIVMRIVAVDGRRVEVTPKEFDLLALFVQNPGRPFSRDELLDRIWRNDFDVTDRTIDTHVQRLRKKLGPAAQTIRTVWGVGYRFESDESSE